MSEVGKRIDATSSALRPPPLVELGHWGGEKLVRGKNVLDIGCGDGRFALGLAPLAVRVEGIDPDPGAIAAARKGARALGLGNVKFSVGAAQKLRFPDSSFDTVLLSWTL